MKGRAGQIHRVAFSGYSRKMAGTLKFRTRIGLENCELPLSLHDEGLSSLNLCVSDRIFEARVKSLSKMKVFEFIRGLPPFKWLPLRPFKAQCDFNKRLDR